MAANDTSAYESIQTDSSVLVPSQAGIAAMRCLPAGMGDDQATRLTKLTGYVKQQELDNLAITLGEVNKIDDARLVSQAKWSSVFTTITKADEKTAIALVKAMVAEDDLAKALLSIHTFNYITVIPHLDI